MLTTVGFHYLQRQYDGSTTTWAHNYETSTLARGPMPRHLLPMVKHPIALGTPTRSPPAQPKKPANEPLCATVTVKALNGYKANSQMLEEVKFRLSCKVCYEPFSAVLGFGGLDNGSLVGTPTMSASVNPMPVVLSCGHVFCCNCVSQAETCPCCRAAVVGKHKVFFP
jgi:hypothetical protein